MATTATAPSFYSACRLPSRHPPATCARTPCVTLPGRRYDPLLHPLHRARAPSAHPVRAPRPPRPPVPVLGHTFQDPGAPRASGYTSGQEQTEGSFSWRRCLQDLAWRPQNGAHLALRAHNGQRVPYGNERQREAYPGVLHGNCTCRFQRVPACQFCG